MQIYILSSDKTILTMFNQMRNAPQKIQIVMSVQNRHNSAARLRIVSFKISTDISDWNNISLFNKEISLII